MRAKTALMFLTAGAPRDEAAATAGYSSVIDMRSGLERYLDVNGWPEIEKTIMLERIDRLTFAVWEKANKEHDQRAVRIALDLIHERRIILGYVGEDVGGQKTGESPQLAMPI